MNSTLIFALGGLLLAFAAAVALGRAIHRIRMRRVAVDDNDATSGSEGMSGVVGFIGGSAAFLLGVLMLSSLDHFNSTREVVTQEALAYSAAFDSTAGLPNPARDDIRRSLVCLMRSVTTNSWAAAEDADLTGSDNTHAWRSRALDHANGFEPTTKVQENSLATLQAELINASKTGQQRLLSAEDNLPTALWALVYLSIFVLTVILAALLRGHPVPMLANIALAAFLIVSAAMVWTLTVFAEPFDKGDGVYIPPRSLNAVIVRLQGTYPGDVWAPCESLKES